MSRLYYLAWLLMAAVLFFVALLFILLNRDVVALDLVVPGWQWQVPVGMAIMFGLVLGAAIGFLAGIGVRVFMSPGQSKGTSIAKS